MTLYELANKYNFHDSLLEKVVYNEKNKLLKMEIDLCNWQQQWYKDGESETELISIIFKDVIKADISELPLNSDEIIEVILLNDIANTIGLQIVAFNDINNTLHTFKIYADDVRVDKYHTNG